MAFSEIDRMRKLLEAHQRIADEWARRLNALEDLQDRQLAQSVERVAKSRALLEKTKRRNSN